ncbi:GNAT family N-acetyltransferase [Rhodoblastus acidophilus]|uniref:L-ornithine N(alpha)-acyltransferase n=1 Tax=Rhodoblastus acidophilus TaxID=1074 RepID=A0A6N8DHN8_RHOAC|nr:GNAT family N-acyltransferase [Rhodoblastus acidophilus]MCW2272757.1 putative hemolysin [Rhodoblastus acidophilus]MTV29668.1 GNAT family N-acetyltransferase [Rhodoblastus acidophilus]
MWGLSPVVGKKIIAGAFRKPFRVLPVTLSGSLGRIGSLEVRLAATRKDLHKAQRLRYKVFFEEGGAIPDARAALTRRDADKFDAFCDHLIVIDHEGRSRTGKKKPTVVGAYRLLRSDVAVKKRGFYSSSEYDLAPLLARHPDKRFLELGRSCVLKPYRGKKTIELLWRGLLAYIRAYDMDALIGCASLEGANPLKHAVALSFLSHHAGADAEWSVRARTELHVPMAMLDKSAMDQRRALASLPPLIKGYLRVGAKFGDGAVVDKKFNTTDVFVVMPVAEMDTRYLEFFGDSERAA